MKLLKQYCVLALKPFDKQLFCKPANQLLFLLSDKLNRKANSFAFSLIRTLAGKFSVRLPSEFLQLQNQITYLLEIIIIRCTSA